MWINVKKNFSPGATMRYFLCYTWWFHVKELCWWCHQENARIKARRQKRDHFPGWLPTYESLSLSAHPNSALTHSGKPLTGTLIHLEVHVKLYSWTNLRWWILRPMTGRQQMTVFSPILWRVDLTWDYQPWSTQANGISLRKMPIIYNPLWRETLFFEHLLYIVQKLVHTLLAVIFIYI